MKELPLEDSYFELCNCGNPHPHVYFHPGEDLNDLLQRPIFSVEAAEALIDALFVTNAFSEVKRIELSAYIHSIHMSEEASMQEKMKIISLRMITSGMFDGFITFSAN